MLILPKNFAETLPGSGDVWANLFNVKGEMVREEYGRRTLRFLHQGKSYFLKTHVGVGWKEIFKNLIQGKIPVISARWEWEALQRLNELGVSCPVAIGFGCRGKNPATRQSFIITEDIGESITLEELWVRWGPKKRLRTEYLRRKRTLIGEVARVARILHTHGMNHRDFYLCHLRVKSENMKSGEARQILPLYLMDLHRAQIRRRTPTRWKIKDLGALLFSCLPFGITRGDRFRFMKVYSEASLREEIENSKGFWNRIERRAIRMYQKHGAPQLAAGLLAPSIEHSVQ